MIPIDRAKRILLDAAPETGKEAVSLEQARGRVLAEPVFADRDHPPTDRSAMDGYAIRCGDLPEGGGSLRLAGEIRAGQARGSLEVEPGTAVRIMTGAIVPPGADTVVMVEDAEEDEAAGTVRFRKVPERGRHIRRRAEVHRAGETVLEPGRPIDAAEIAAMASVGKVRVEVGRLPRVALLTTGDEIVPPAGEPEEHQIRNSNSPTLLAQLEAMGITGHDLGTASDIGDDLDRAVAEGLESDLFLLTGGVSMGRYDRVGEALAGAGVEQLFHKVSVKPGKPLLAGKRGGCLVAGLPGNPVSAFTGFAIFLAPVIRKMTGMRHWDNATVNATVEEPLRGSGGRTVYALVRAEWSGGRFRVRPVRSTGSGDVVSMARANAFAICPSGSGTVPAGTEVEVVLWNGFHLRPV